MTGLFAYFYFYLGFSKEVINQGIVEDKFYVLGTSHVGPYHKINALITEVETWTKENNIPCPLTFGLFLDDPKISEENRLRSEVGCLTKTPVYESYTEKSTKYFVKQLPNKRFLKFSFSGSPAISPFVVYPKAEEWFQKTNYKQDKFVLEVYEQFGNSLTTHYYFPIEEAN